MATDKDVTTLKRQMRALKAHLARQYVWERKVMNNLKRLNRKVGGLGGPNITEPPPPPKKP